MPVADETWSYDDPWSFLLPRPEGHGGEKTLSEEVVKRFQDANFGLGEIPVLPPPVSLRA
jgi:hypothetical protein